MSNLSDNQNRRVLVIDDNHSIHDDFRKILSPSGPAQSGGEDCEVALFGDSDNTVGPPQFDLDSAFQGQEGAIMVKRALKEARPYAMAFVDMRMPPGWDGIETTQRIWEIDPDIQIVICTAYSDYSWSEILGTVGRRDGLLILKKPFDTVEASQLAYALTEKWWSQKLARRKSEDLESQVAERTRVLQQTNGALQTEVAERKQAEEALRESEKRFSGAFEYAPIGVALVSLDGQWLKVNRVLCELVGYSEIELLSRTFQDITHPEDLDKDLANVSQMLAGEIRCYQIEKRYIHARGHLVTVLLDVSLVHDVQNQPLHFIAQIQNITARKEAAESLATSEERYRSLYAESRDAIMIVSPEKGSLACNPATISLFVCQEEKEFITQSPASLSPECQPDGSKSVEKIQEMMRVALEQGSHYFEWTHRKMNGRKFAAKVLLSRIGSGAQRLLQVTIRDITKRKEAEAAKLRLEAQNRQLQKSESLSRMAGAIAHHFNNQLQAVMMGLEMAMNDLPQNSGLLLSLADAHECACKAAEVSSLMLTCLGQTVSKRESLDLSEACLRSLPLLRLAMPRNMLLVTNLPSPGPLIQADANQIQRVLTNLVTNAKEAGADKEVAIRLTVKTVSASDITAENRFPINCQMHESAYACLEIADTGIGIAQRDIEQIFDPFFSTKFTGRGLGLAVALGIVRAHGGAITVDSERGRGSVFRVFLPASVELVPHKPVQVTRDLKSFAGGMVLLVEDEASVRKIVTIALKNLGFAVLPAVDGVEALEVFQLHRDEIRLVLCDLAMPRKDGWETLTALRKLAPGFPVILASGHSETLVLAGDHAERPQAVLTKPYTFEKLRDTVASVLDNPAIPETARNIGEDTHSQQDPRVPPLVTRPD